MLFAYRACRDVSSGHMQKPWRCLIGICLMTPLPSPGIVDGAQQILNPHAAKPPVAERRPKVVGLHGYRIEDAYFWLREKGSPAVLDYLRAENRYTTAVMEPFKAFEDALYQEML